MLDLLFGIMITIILVFGLYVYYQNLPIKNTVLELKKCKKWDGTALLTIVSDDTLNAAKLMVKSARKCGYTGKIIFASYNLSDSDCIHLDGLFERIEQLPLAAIFKARVGRVLLTNPHIIWLDNPKHILDSLNKTNVLVQWADMERISPFDHVRRQVREFVQYIIPGNPVTEQVRDNYVSDGLIALNMNSSPLRCALAHLADLGWFHKEMFWVAAEMARTGYTIVDPGTCMVGKGKGTGMLCGSIGYIDDAGKLVAIHAGEIRELPDYDTIGIGQLSLNGHCVSEPKTVPIESFNRDFINNLCRTFYQPD